MIFNETQILKDAIEYLDEQLTDVHLCHKKLAGYGL